MNGRSPNVARFSGGTPSRNQYVARQPLYLPSFSPHMSPRGRTSSPNNSPDFIPLGMSSPVGRLQKSWSNRNHNSYNSSFSSGDGASPGSNSSYNPSPYRRNSPRGHPRGRGGVLNRPVTPNITQYIDREMLQNPWAELEQAMNIRDGKNSPLSEDKFNLEISENKSANVDDSEQEEVTDSGGENCSYK